jgi:hypothetical protein
MDNTPLQQCSVFLRSSDYTRADDTNKSNLFFDLNTPIRCFSNMQINTQLVSFKFCNSFYTINETNCNFYYKFSGGSIVSVSLIKSNYTIDTFLNYLSSLLSGIFIFSYDSGTLKITISSVSAQPFLLNAGLNNCLEVLGFDEINDSAYNNIQVASYLMNLIGTEILHITIPNIILNTIGVKNQRKYNILDSVHVLVPKGETQTYFNQSQYFHKIYENNITFLNIVILDQNFNVVNFNNIDFYINIIFTFSYANDLILPKSLKDMQEKTMREELLEEEQRYLENNIL